jgi:2-polyprenyl-3-methyl-5-hydroxy-6-metoxy-1,4-benzoquinol methylase
MKKLPTSEEIMKVYYTDQREEMTHFIPLSCKHILEVGCGEGNFGKLLKDERNVEVWGIELSETAAKVAGTRLDRALSGDFHLNYPQLPKSYFDCIVFNDVLEHFTDPERVLILCREVLSKGGYIVCSIPNVRYIRNLYEVLIQKDWEYKAGGILDRTHYRFFTQKSIIRMFTVTGYAVISCTGVNATNNILARLLGFFTFGYMADVRYLEFATVARLD